MKKRLFTIAAIMVCGLSLVGCTTQSGVEPDTTGTASSESTSTPSTDSPVPLATAAPAPAEGITYTVEGNSPTAISVSYASLESGSYEIKETQEVALPWSLTFTGVSQEDFGDNGLTLIAQTDGQGSSIRCRITNNGTTISEQSVDGAYGVAICSSLTQ